MIRRLNNCFLLVLPMFANKKGNEKLEAPTKHLLGYLSELKLHFDLDDKDLINILYHTIGSIKPSKPFFKCLNMVKLWNFRF